MLFEQQNPTDSLRRVKKLVNKRPHSPGPKESGPLHLAPVGPINPRPHFAVCPRLPLRTAPMAPAWRGGGNAPPNKPHRGARRGEDGRGEPADLLPNGCHHLHNPTRPFPARKGRARASLLQRNPRGSPRSPFPAGKGSKLAQPWQARPPYPTLSVRCPVQVSASICQELFLQVKLHRSKEKSGDRTRRSIQTPHLIKHPIHNRLH